LEEASRIALGTTGVAEFWPAPGDALGSTVVTLLGIAPGIAFASGLETTPGRTPGSGFWMAETTLGTAFGAALETGTGTVFWTSGSTPGMAFATPLAFALGTAFGAGCGRVLESEFESTFATVLDRLAAAWDTSETGGNIDAACGGSFSFWT